MRLMAFDYGTKRIGIAVSDSMQIIASPLTNIHPEEIWKFLSEYLVEEQVETFIIGKPKKLDGTASESDQHVVGFSRKLRKTYPHIPIEEVDERFTSKIASQAISVSGMKKSKKQDKGLIDKVSAVLILQSYMDSKSF
ncbi:MULTISPECIES: Holliday junction resolvase RuvX [Sphingobacterium]|uniref:Putative pre-16S rRNA nuclease n=1 Tax=Sphingobacterium cellulitidis TaxID=1768011 RepID=A0A8H9G0D2_9SPHI|nr:MULTISPECIES: Holliday junction resolvase RuvX [Sphingobacterium]MBA8987540.1 putative Holliday junction resolvase [Sphingobacterium soli]OYD41836.1 Holliday junction resolvase RuvX [Sphingobacterium cellulitidis]OYD46528.1 Holliday junction resolvase RuvX [Sphingobacterium cellulitidis]WFB63256.1 Holliday junction resolvase RuvX [Sphingobacterium sp. WM]GGE24148.1 putative pre-16S rRNA nuclease [Sphingobacterium soli]